MPSPPVWRGRDWKFWIVMHFSGRLLTKARRVVSNARDSPFNGVTATDVFTVLGSKGLFTPSTLPRKTGANLSRLPMRRGTPSAATFSANDSRTASTRNATVLSFRLSERL